MIWNGDDEDIDNVMMEVSQVIMQVKVMAS